MASAHVRVMKTKGLRLLAQVGLRASSEDRSCCGTRKLIAHSGAQVSLRAMHMERGTQFLKSQVNSAVMQHGVFLSVLEAHEDQAEDDRFRDLCSRHIPQMREHQRMLEEYQSQLGGDGGPGKKILG